MEKGKEEIEPTPESKPQSKPTKPIPEPKPVAEPVPVPEETPGEVRVEKGKVEPKQLEEIEVGEYYTISQVATKLNFSKFYIWELIQKGRIKAIKPLGGRWRVPKSEYDKLVKEGLPPLPRVAKEKPAVTEIVVEEEVVSKVKEPQKQEQKPPPLFDLDFLNLFKKK